MKTIWFKTIAPIAAIFSFRMLGLFMLIPVFSVYATSLTGATPFLIGMALGCYGLSQGLLQIPFGLLSDKYGRKPVIALGLGLFALGSLLGALTHSMTGMIIARTLQGTGAIGSVLIALLADLTPDDCRTSAMAMIGGTIALSFSLAFMISPVITEYAGLSGIFYITLFLIVFAFLLLYFVIPTPSQEPFIDTSTTQQHRLKLVIKNPHLSRLNIGIFSQHLILTSTFFAIPLRLQEEIASGHLNKAWHFYLPILVLSFIAMLPPIILAERRKKMKPIFISAVFITAIAQGGLALAAPLWTALCVLMFIYFVVFNILEASLPSLISRQASMMAKGTAMGVYSSCQFLGIFAGGTLAGLLYQHHGSQGIFILNTLIAIIWFCITLKMTPHHYQTTLSLVFDDQNVDELLNTLKTLPGVEEVMQQPNKKNALYLRINKAHYKEGSAEQHCKKS